MTQQTDGVEARLTRLEASNRSIIRMLSGAVQRIEGLDREVRALHGGSDTFQVPAPVSRVEGDSRLMLMLPLVCKPCDAGEFVHKVELSEDGLLIRCASGHTRRATGEECEMVREFTAQYLGAATFHAQQAEVQPRVRASQVLG